MDHVAERVPLLDEREREGVELPGLDEILGRRDLVLRDEKARARGVGDELADRGRLLGLTLGDRVGRGLDRDHHGLGRVGGLVEQARDRLQILGVLLQLREPRIVLRIAAPLIGRSLLLVEDRRDSLLDVGDLVRGERAVDERLEVGDGLGRGELGLELLDASLLGLLLLLLSVVELLAASDDLLLLLLDALGRERLLERVESLELLALLRLRDRGRVELDCLDVLRRGDVELLGFLRLVGLGFRRRAFLSSSGANLAASFASASFLRSGSLAVAAAIDPCSLLRASEWP